MSLRILGCILIVLYGIQAFPQKRQQESPVIFIDFNLNNKPSEKTLRSLDQISLQDGTVQGRNSYTDSYGNPVAYDSLDDVDAKKPSKNPDNPHQYVIPGYASGILQPHEVPSRGSADDEARTIGDDKIHFVDPLNPKSFQSFNSVPSTSLSLPGIDNTNVQSPIEIPRPNIDLNETPIENPSSQAFEPPVNSNPSNAPPSTILELPLDQNPINRPFSTGLTPPQIPNVDGVDIPRPNLNAHETPIDDSQNALNQGLLPPTSAQPNFNTFSNPTQNIPVVITDDQTVFAPKPSNGLLPPKDPLPADFDFQSPTKINDLPSVTSASKFSGTFGGSIHGDKSTTTPAPLFIPVQVIHSQDDGKINKYTGGFGGAPGILVNSNQAPPTVNRIQPTPSPVINTVAPTHATHNVNKFTGSFGGSLGVLSPGNSASAVPSTIQSVTNTPVPLSNKFTGTFGGSLGVLSPANSLSGSPSTIQTATNSPIPLSNRLSSTSNNKKVLTFGGPAGVLRPYDNLDKN